MEPVGGTGWSVIDQIGVQGQSANAYGFTVDSNDNLYVAGAASDNTQPGGEYGFVRMMPATPVANFTTFSTAAITDITLQRDPLLFPDPDETSVLA
jgi:hypothetical protein